MKSFELRQITPNHQVTVFHSRGSSQPVPKSFSNSPVSNTRESPSSFDDFELYLLNKSKLVGLAIPYKALGNKIQVITSKVSDLQSIKVPLIKKLPFGLHKYDEIEPKFRDIFTQARSKRLTEKKVKHLKLLSGRLNIKK
jgi:hypothetical protein